jgi:hypothetical protein
MAAARPQKARRTRRAFLLCALLVLAGCADGSPLDSRQQIADRIAASAGLTPVRLRSGPFELLGYRRYAAPETSTLSVYLEGDGLAWNAFGTAPSRDPTPRDPVALRLMAVDPAPNRLYLARPCQYLSDAALARCSDAYWTSHRFAEEVVAATTDIVKYEMTASGMKRARLSGYSGGGALAALVAARLAGATRLVTVAAPLDHAYWTQAMKVTPMFGSLNPVDMANRLSALPQAHIVSSRDSVVPVSVVWRYVDALPHAVGRVRVVSTDAADHWCCWPELWPDLLQQVEVALAGVPSPR